MMALANVLGLLGLLGIVGLILIYIIKPNFQQKFVSTTHIWELSLKYKKKRVPINNLRNLLLIICQVLILTSCALILAKPVLKAQEAEQYTEKIVIIEASVGMKATYNGETRFLRAVSQAKEYVNEVLSDEEGRVTVIIANDDPFVLTVDYTDMDGISSSVKISRLGNDYIDVINEKFDFMINDLSLGIDEYCTYGSADLEGAMIIAEDVSALNPNSEVVLYTGTDYVNSGIVTVKNVKLDGERNAAILDGTATVNERFVYSFAVDVAVYGQDVSGVEISFTIKGANPSVANSYAGTDLDPFTITVDCNNDEVVHVEFNTYKESVKAGYAEKNAIPLSKYSDEEWDEILAMLDDDDIAELDLNIKPMITGYNSVYVEINANTSSTFVDVLPYDDSFFFYGGTKPIIKVQYASKKPNTFWSSVTSTWTKVLATKWDVQVDEVNEDVVAEKKYAIDGYDIYIFEQVQPDKLPQDGVIILSSPTNVSSIPGLSNMAILNKRDWDKAYILNVASSAKKHPLMQSLVGSEYYFTEGKSMSLDGDDWVELMTTTFSSSSVDGESFDLKGTVVAAKNTVDTKMLVMTFPLNQSDIQMYPERFMLFGMDIFNYFYPSVMTEFLYDIGETVTVNSFSNIMYCMKPDANLGGEALDTFPATIVLDQIGTYTLTQNKLSGEEVKTEFYVKTPTAESNVLRTEDELVQPYVFNDEGEQAIDLLIWFAAALVALLFVEWWLQSRDQF